MLKKLIEALFGKRHESARIFDWAGMNDTRARLHKMKERPAGRPRPMTMPVAEAPVTQFKIPTMIKEVPMVNEAFLVAVDADYSVTSFHRDNPRARAQRNFLDASKDELCPELAVRKAMPSIQGVRNRDRDAIRKWFAADKFDEDALEQHLTAAAPARTRELVRHEAFRQTRTNLPSMGVGESKVIFQGIQYEVTGQEAILSSQEETGTFFPSFAESLGSETYVDPGSYVSASSMAGFVEEPPPRASRYEPIAGARHSDSDDEVPEWMQKLLSGEAIPEAHAEGGSGWIENTDFDAAKVRHDIKAPKDVDLSSALTAHAEEEAPCCEEKAEVAAQPCCAEKIEAPACEEEKAPRTSASHTAAKPNEVRSAKKKKRNKK